MDIELAGDDLYVTTTSSHRFHKFNRMFEPQWSLDQGTLPECEAFQVAARGQRLGREHNLEIISLLNETEAKDIV